MSIDRLTHLIAGIILATALTLANTVNPAWMWLAALPTFGLFLDALTGFCPMRAILKATIKKPASA